MKHQPSYYVKDLASGYYVGYEHTLVRHHFYARRCPSVARAVKIAKLANIGTFEIRCSRFFGLFTKHVQYIPF